MLSYKVSEDFFGPNATLTLVPQSVAPHYLSLPLYPSLVCVLRRSLTEISLGVRNFCEDLSIYAPELNALSVFIKLEYICHNFLCGIV